MTMLEIPFIVGIVTASMCADRFQTKALRKRRERTTEDVHAKG